MTLTSTPRLDIAYCIMNERYVLQPALDCIAAGVALDIKVILTPPCRSTIH